MRTREQHRRRLAVEFAGRVLLVVLTVHLLPYVFVGDISHFRRAARAVDFSHLPYRSVLWEFPPLTLPFLALEKITGGSRALYLSLFALVTVSLELASLELLRRAWPEHDRDLTWIWSATVLPVATLAYFRFDFLAVLFATLALIGIEHRRATVWPIVAGVAAKLWPGLLLVVVIVQRRWRTLAAGVAGCIALVAAWYAFSPSGFHDFLRYRAGKGLEVESVPASLRLLGHHGPFLVRSGAWVIDAGGFRWVDPLMGLCLIVFTVTIGLWAYRRPSCDLVALGAALVLASMVFSRLLSAQYLTWLSPFVALLWVRGHKLVGRLTIVAVWLTVIQLLWFEQHLIKGSKLMGAVVLGRNAVLVVLLVVLVRAAGHGNERKAPGSSLVGSIDG